MGTLGHDLILSILPVSEYSHKAAAKDLTIFRKAKVAPETHNKPIGCSGLNSFAVALPSGTAPQPFVDDLDWAVHS